MTLSRKKRPAPNNISTQMDLFCSKSNLPILNENQDERSGRLAEISAHNRAAALLRFVVKKHRASRLHYDVRLEWNGWLKSWAVPQGPSCCAGDYREAVEVADHKVENLAFEGVFPEGMPGAGPTMPWDLGYYEPLPGYQDIDESMRRGRLEFTLYGEKLKGIWMLLRRPGSCQGARRQVWDLIKLPDDFARSKDAPAIVDEQPNSVLSGRSLEDVEREWKPRKKRKSGPTLFEMD